jgi:hypothetical protein
MKKVILFGFISFLFLLVVDVGVKANTAMQNDQTIVDQSLKSLNFALDVGVVVNTSNVITLIGTTGYPEATISPGVMSISENTTMHIFHAYAEMVINKKAEMMQMDPTNCLFGTHKEILPNSAMTMIAMNQTTGSDKSGDYQILLE